MARILNIFLAAVVFAACADDGDKLPSAAGVYSLSLGKENRMPSVDHFFPSYYNIELLEADSLHPVMEITYMSRRQSGGDYRWVDAVLRMDITAEQRALLRELMYEGAWAP
ncbi:MAG: hypothetical protein IJZ22_05485 [Bacteroidaceae bacterium]|nr:hypothetical protein [Bacteroidaceae bacterium]